MRSLLVALLPLCLAPVCSAQLTQQQKIADFNQLAALYAVNYGPYELKRDLFGFDLYNLQPWLDQIAKSKTDLDFLDICTRYVASLRDSHDEFVLSSNFDAWLHFDGDLYDGKLIIDNIDRTYLSRIKFPFAVGDELVSVDGTDVATLLEKLAPYSANGASNPVSRNRLAAALITERVQSIYPAAADIAETATVVIKRQSGATETYAIPWDIVGSKLVNVGLIPVPHAVHATGETHPPIFRQRGGDETKPNPWNVSTGTAETAPDVPADSMTGQQKLGHLRAFSIGGSFNHLSGLNPFDSMTPVFGPPPGFVQRLGAKATDQFLSGTFKSGGNNIGLIRIPTFAPASTSTALNQFATEIVYFQQNTDGLIVDVMANGGGDGCYTESMASFLIPFTFQGLSEQIRATTSWRQYFDAQAALAKLTGEPQWVTDLYNQYVAQVDQALAENRGLTGNLPICNYTFDVPPPVNGKGAIVSYTKPIILLTDNFTLSAAEVFSMFLQDNQRATIVGTPTDGGGGNVVGYDSVTNYSQGYARVTEGIITRLNPVATPGFPAIGYYDGVGIYPDVVEDYMTVDNLMHRGTTFVSDITAVLNELIAKAK